MLIGHSAHKYNESLTQYTCILVHILVHEIVEQACVVSVVSDAAADVVAIIVAVVVVVSFVLAHVVVVAVEVMNADNVVRHRCVVVAAVDTVGFVRLEYIFVAVDGHAIVAVVDIADAGVEVTAWYLTLLHALRGKCSLQYEELSAMKTASLSRVQRTL